jgi:hypothetical protein
MPDPDLEFSATDRARLRRLEKRMCACGFVRHPAHGFWISREQALAAKAGPQTVADEHDEE